MIRLQLGGLGTRLLFLVFLSLLPAFGLILYTGHTERQRERKEISQHALQLARLITLTHDQQLERLRSLFSGVAHNISELTLEPEGCSQLLGKFLEQHPACVTLGIVEPGGRILCKAGLASPTVNLADRRWFRQTIETGHFTVGHYENEPGITQPILPVGYPILNQAGQVQAILLAALDLGWITESADRLQLHKEQFRLTLLDREGQVLVRHPQEGNWRGRDLSKLPMFRSLLQQGEGIAEFPDTDGVPRLYALTPLPAVPEQSIYLLASIPSRVAFASIDQAMIDNLWKLGGMYLLVLLLASVGTKWLVLRHVNALIDITKRFADGDWSVRAGNVFKSGELRRLAEAFNSMAESLQQREQQRHESEQKLLRSRQTLATLFESLPFSVVIIDQNRKILDVNPVFLHSAGFDSKEQLLGQDCTSVFCLPGEGRCPVLDLGQELHWSEKVLITRAGEKIPILKSVVPILLEGQEVLLEAFVDISERKEAERAIQQSEQRYRAVVQDMPAMICRFLPNGKLTFINSAFCEFVGISQAELMGQDFFQFLPEVKRQTVKQHYQSLTATRPMTVHQHQVYFRNGTMHWQQWTDRALFNDQGELFEYQFVGIDITGQKQVEETLRLNERRLEALLQIYQMADGPLEEIVDFVLEEGIRLTHSRIGYLAFVNDDETVATMYAWSKQAISECSIPDKDIVFPVESTGLWGEALRQRKPIITNDYQAENPLKRGYPEGHVTLLRHMNVPVFDGEHIVAVVGVGNKHDPYDDSDIRQLTLLMNEMWSLIRRRHAKVELQKSLEETDKSRQRLKALLEASRMVMEQGNFATAANNVFEKCKDLLGAATGCLAFFDPTDDSKAELCQESSDLFCLMTAELPSPIKELQRRAQQTQQVVYQNKLVAPLHSHSPSTAPVKLENVLFSPLVIDRKTSGLLGLINKPGGFRDEDVQVVTAFSELAALAFLNHRASESLKESEERFRTAFDMIPDAISIRKIDGTFVDINKGFTNLTGYSREQIVNQPASAIQFWENPQDETMLLTLLTQQNYVNNFKSLIRCQDGQLKTTRTLARIIVLRGKPHILIVSQDVTQQQQLEAQLRQAQKMEALGTLAGGIAHDFNNILGIIVGYVDLALLHIPNDSTPQKLLQHVQTATQRAKDLVQQILTFSRQSEQEIKPLEVGLLIKETLKLLRATLPSTITINYKITSKDLVLADPTQIHQVMMNLCTNAAHAMRDQGGTLGVILDRVDFNASDPSRPVELVPGSYVKLTVSDTGHGMSPEIVDRIFDPYFTTKGPGAGTGLGLAVVHGIVKSHQGAITVHSEPNVGTVFEIFFRKWQRGSQTIKQPLSARVPGGTERILLVDDEIELLQAAKAMLEHLGYRVTALANSQAALNLFLTQPEQFDLIITDQTMPHLTGTQLAKEILGVRADTPIILCTGFSEGITGESVRAMGIRKLTAKPFEMQALAVAVREVLDGA